MLTECRGCGDPLLDDIKACPSCGTLNPQYRGNESDPKARMPPMEGAAASIAGMSFVMTFVFGMAAATHLPGPVPSDLRWLLTTALVSTLSAGFFIVASERLSPAAKQLTFLFIIGSYAAWTFFAE